MALNRVVFPISLLIILFLLTFISFKFLSKYLFDWQFRNQIEQIISTEKEREYEIKKVMDGLIETLTFTCSEVDKILLKETKNRSQHILLTGIITKNKKTCSSLGQRYSFSFNDINEHPIGVLNTFIFSVDDFNSSSHKFALAYRNKDAILVAILNSASFNRLIEKRCQDCFYIELSLGGKVVLKIGNISIKDEQHIQKKAIKSYNNKIDITIYAGNRLYDLTKQKLFEVIALIFTMIILTGIAIFYFISIKRKTLTEKIKLAIKNKDFMPFYQPIIDVNTSKLVGLEVLIRWQENDKWISPEKLVSCAEENGLIMAVTKVLFEKVLTDAKFLPDDVWLSINISAKHFEGEHLVELLSNTNTAHSSQISLEITERHPIKNEVSRFYSAIS